jgi:hypothetical protein
MIDLQDVLTRIRENKDKYDNCQLSLVADQTEILRSLSISYSDLSEHRIEENNNWNEAYFEAQGSNAFRSKEADRKVPQMYLLRRTMESTKILIDTVRSTLSTAKMDRN